MAGHQLRTVHRDAIPAEGGQTPAQPFRRTAPHRKEAGLEIAAGQQFVRVGAAFIFARLDAEYSHSSHRREPGKRPVSTPPFAAVLLGRKGGLPASECGGLLAEGVAWRDFAMVSGDRGPRLNIFNNVTVTCIAPSAAGLNVTEAAN